MKTMENLHSRVSDFTHYNTTAKATENFCTYWIHVYTLHTST